MRPDPDAELADCTKIVSFLRSWWRSEREWPAVTWMALPQNVLSRSANPSSGPHGMSTRCTWLT